MTKIAIVAPLLALVLCCAACGRESGGLSGVYEAHGAAGTVVLELKDDGQGVWSTENDEQTFKWTRHGEEIRLHTKAGGVLVGQVSGGSIQIDLPGVGSFSFARKGV